MKTNSLSIGPELKAALGECRPGETKQVLLTITVNNADDAGLDGTVVAVEPYEAPAEEEPEMAPPGPAAPGAGSPALQAAIQA